MLLTWYGNCCFLLKTNLGKRILFDPIEYKDSSSCIIPNCDIVAISHSFFNNTYIKSNYPNSIIIDTPGIFTFNEINIECIQTFHDDFNGFKRGKNMIFIVTIDNLRLCHLGHIGHLPEKKVLEKLMNIDILLIPLQRTFTLNGDLAAKLCAAILPKYVIPMNYSSSDLFFYDDFTKLSQSIKIIYNLKSSTIDLDEVKQSNTTEINLLLPKST